VSTNTTVPTHVADSAPASQAEARKAGLLVLNWTGGKCLCGCGRTTLSRFAPGHDARLRGQLTRAAVAGTGVRVRDGEAFTDTTPEAVAATLSTPKHDWVAWVREAAAAAKKRAAAAAEREKAAAERKAEAAAKGTGAPRPSLSDLLPKADDAA